MTLLQIHDLSHCLGNTKILENVNLTVKSGSILGLVGINGAGKSTLLRILAGVYIPDEGRISYDGCDPRHASTRQRIFFLPDDPYFSAQTTCRSMVKMYRSFYPDMDINLCQRYLSNFNLDMKKPLRTFSKGMRRQAYIAVALSIRPDFLLLDEAFDGLDPVARHTVKQELIRLVEEKDATVIISSHALRELEDFCDSYAVLDHMTVTSSGDIADKVSHYCLFQLAFLGGVPEEAWAHFPVVSISVSGKFVKVMLDGNSDEMRSRLQTLKPDVMEELPVNFEEAFISDVQKKEGQ